MLLLRRCPRLLGLLLADALAHVGVDDEGHHAACLTRGVACACNRIGSARPRRRTHDLRIVLQPHGGVLKGKGIGADGLQYHLLIIAELR